MEAIRRFFQLEENSTTIRTEVLAGLTTFLTMAYIIFVQPAVLSGAMFGRETGMDFGAVTVATCLAAALATAIMGIYARLPIAQAPGMGENFLFVFGAIAAAGQLEAVANGESSAWQIAMGAVLIAGVLFLIISLVGIREAISNAISPNMKSAIAVGIGIFIAFIGLQNASLVIPHPTKAVELNANVLNPDIVVFCVGLLVTAVLYTRKKRGAIIWGIIAATIAAVVFKIGVSLPDQVPEMLASEKMARFTPDWRLVSLPPSLGPTWFQFDVKHVFLKPGGGFVWSMIPFIIIFLVMDLFDTIGTLTGVGTAAGLMREGKLIRGKRAMVSDAVGTVAGACLGTSTVTSFIESAAGVEEGGRTGLTAVTVAVLFLLALFFTPLVGIVGSYPPITAPALVAVGAMMIRNVKDIDWSDYSESLPSFLVMLGIPLFYSIGDGLAIGFIAYPIIKLFSGRVKEVKWLMYVLAVILLLYFIFVRT